MAAMVRAALEDPGAFGIREDVADEMAEASTVFEESEEAES